MSVRGPLVTAVIVVGGLVGFMTVNSVGGLVVAEDAAESSAAVSEAANAQADSSTAETTTGAPETTEIPTDVPATTEPPAETAEEEPAPAPFPAEAVYAGEVDGGPMTIAVAIKGEEAAAYICDGAAVESWLQGTAIDGKLDLKSKDGKNRVVAQLKDKALAGTVTVAGKELPFGVPAAKAPAGVYRGEGADATIGWIILPDGSQVGISTSNGRSEPAPPLDPAKGSVTVDGSRVTAVKIAGDTEF